MNRVFLILFLFSAACAPKNNSITDPGFDLVPYNENCGDKKDILFIYGVESQNREYCFEKNSLYCYITYAGLLDQFGTPVDIKKCSVISQYEMADQDYLNYIEDVRAEDERNVIVR